MVLEIKLLCGILLILSAVDSQVFLDAFETFCIFNLAVFPFAMGSDLKETSWR